MGILQYETSGSSLRMITAASYRLDDKALVSTETPMLPESFGAIVSFFLSKVILRAAPQRIAYVSCNPATQARGLALLMAEGQYRAVRACAVDMFPHTHHVEHVVLLERV